MKTLLSTLLFSLVSQLSFAEPTAEEIMKKSFLSNKVKDSFSRASFRLINESGDERKRETTSVTKLTPGTTDNRRVVTFEAPADVKGTKTLMVEHSGGDDDIWIYLPAMKKVRRLVASNKKDSFVGTDFSYGDVIGHKVEDWTHKFLKEEKFNGKDCYVIESLPKKPDVASDSGYAKRVSWVDKESFVTLLGEAFDSNGELLKKIIAEDVKLVDKKLNRWQAMKLTAGNVQTKHKTIIQFRDFKANAGIKDNVFTTRYLEK